MRLIDADALYEFIQDQMEKETGAYTRGKNKAFNIVKSALHNECAAPTIEAEPVKHGRWEVHPKDTCAAFKHLEKLRCTNCWHFLYHNYGDDKNYCPNCGAKMDGEG